MAPVTVELAARKLLVLDANILLRGVLGVRVRKLLDAYGDSVDFFTPGVCFDDARRLVNELAVERNFDPVPALLLLEELAQVVESVDRSIYSEYEAAARSRIASRDPDDWPIVATALLFDCPVWTEDQDFFGCGVATWTTHNVELYLRGK
jgi:predicted nucleic acid-binding protein